MALAAVAGEVVAADSVVDRAVDLAVSAVVILVVAVHLAVGNIFAKKC